MRRLFSILVAVVITVFLTGCTSAKETAQKAVDEYNAKVEEYSAAIAEYNTAAKQRNDNIQQLKTEIDSCQATINKQEEAFDPDTLTELKSLMTSVQGDMAAEVELLPEYKVIQLNDEMTDEELKAITEQASADMEAMQGIEIPEAAESVDYTDSIASLQEAHEKYEDSIQSLKQITAPSDEFVMDRLKRIENIIAIDHVTEDRDPNEHLNKAGWYIGTIYYTDARIDRSLLYLEDEDDVIASATEGGGAIEIYPDRESAERREAYFTSLDGSILSNGSHHLYGTIIIRISDHLKASEQNEMTETILNELIKIDK